MRALHHVVVGKPVVPAPCSPSDSGAVAYRVCARASRVGRDVALEARASVLGPGEVAGVWAHVGDVCEASGALLERGAEIQSSIVPNLRRVDDLPVLDVAHRPGRVAQLRMSLTRLTRGPVNVMHSRLNTCERDALATEYVRAGNENAVCVAAF